MDTPTLSLTLWAIGSAAGSDLLREIEAQKKFEARREQMMREDEMDVTWNDNRTLEGDE